MTNTPGEDRPQDPQPGEGEPGYSPQQEGGQQPGYGQTPGQGQTPEYGQTPEDEQTRRYEQMPGYGQAYPSQAPMAYAPDHPRATTALVLGILGLILCQVIAPFAWVIGKRAVDEIDASRGQIGGRGAANAGYVLGIIGTVLLIGGLLIGILVVTIIGIGTWTSSY